MQKNKYVSARFLFQLSTRKTTVHSDGLFIIVLYVIAVVL